MQLAKLELWRTLNQWQVAMELFFFLFEVNKVTKLSIRELRGGRPETAPIPRRAFRVSHVQIVIFGLFCFFSLNIRAEIFFRFRQTGVKLF